MEVISFYLQPFAPYGLNRGLLVGWLVGWMDGDNFHVIVILFWSHYGLNIFPL